MTLTTPMTRGPAAQVQGPAPESASLRRGSGHLSSGSTETGLSKTLEPVFPAREAFSPPAFCLLFLGAWRGGLEDLDRGRLLPPFFSHRVPDYLVQLLQVEGLPLQKGLGQGLQGLPVAAQKVPGPLVVLHDQPLDLGVDEPGRLLE